MTALWPMLQEIAHTVTPDVRDRNDLMDILAYVHIKRLRAATDRPQAQVRRSCAMRFIVQHAEFSCILLFKKDWINENS